MKAMIAGNAAQYGAPVETHKDARRKTEAWRTFVNSLTWEKLQEKGRKKMTVKDVLGPLGSLGHLIKVKKSDK